MLTKEFLLYKKVNGYLKPRFIDANHPVWLELAGKILALYRQAAENHFPRVQVGELVQLEVQTGNWGKSGGGIAATANKLAKWSMPENSGNCGTERKRIFLRSAEILRSASSGLSLADYQQQMPIAPLTDLYGDLPDNEFVLEFPKILTPHNLLERYNLGLVQGLLLNAQELEFTLKNPPPQELRRIFKYLKFCRLLARISGGKVSEKGVGKVLKINVSGPLSLLSEVRKYGVQLSTFFPAVLKLKTWKMSAEIKLPGGVYKLVLDQDSNLVSHYRNFSAYVPEEIRMFHELFKQQIEQYEIVGDSPFITLPGGEVIFPDLAFKSHGSGKVFYLELLHRYHAGVLAQRRIQMTENLLPENLIIGIDRSLMDKKTEISDFCADFPQKLFLFRDFPGVERVCKFLKALDL